MRLTMKTCGHLAFLCLSAIVHEVYSQSQTLDDKLHHLRNSETQEWSEFPKETSQNRVKIPFSARVNTQEFTLSLRQYDVKQDWRVRLNEHDMGTLVTDEKDMRVYFAVPRNVLRDGLNEMQIVCVNEIPDDVRVGEFIVYDRPLTDVLSEASLDIQVMDINSNQLLPSRITIVDQKGCLQTVFPGDNKNLAVRPGVIYTADGKASFKIPAGKYKVYAGRGFEYGIDSLDITLKSGDRLQKTLRIRREVSTEGWITCDTHIHTFTHSGHGDASTLERAITIAGEGIEMPILTDHNIYVDLTPEAKAAGVNSYFTAVTGDEVTTKFGHFNVFKTETGRPVINHEAKDWPDVMQKIYDGTNTKAIILNHARDIHVGFRPFGPDRHLSSAGMPVDDTRFLANAMEVVNSGSQQTNIMNLFYDWFGMMNRGNFITPVGSSDSHDVSRYIVGQGRTYIQEDDSDVANIRIDSAIKRFKEGRVMVSLGLLTKIIINDKYGPGDIVPAGVPIKATVEVWGPAWTKADRVSLYANGAIMHTRKIADAGIAGLKSKITWEIPATKHDINLVAIAEGPAERMPYWPIAKPYQPASPDWTPKVLGSTGAVWIDADKNGKRNPALDYAVRIIDSSEGDIKKIVKSLAAYDEAVAIQVAVSLWLYGRDLMSPDIESALKTGSAATKSGFKKVTQETQLLK